MRADIIEALVRERHKAKLDQLVEQLKNTSDWAVKNPVLQTAHSAADSQATAM